MNTISCTTDVFERTIAILRAGGDRREERVVLWLAPRSARRPPVPIVEVYEPEQITAIDFFKLPNDSIRALMGHLNASALNIAAQVHSHPGKAFHSKADDEWAIVRHVGALSLVLPMFARDTTPENFLQRSATYELAIDNKWLSVPNTGPNGRIGVK